MEITDDLLESLWTSAVRTPIKPEKTRRARIMTKWRRLVVKAQKTYLKIAWENNEMVVIWQGDGCGLVRSSSRMDVFHAFDLNTQMCSCEAKGEFQTVQICRHLKKLNNLQRDVLDSAVKRVLSNPVKSPGKIVNLSDHLHRTASHG